jgi:hypothetical protein
MSEIVRNAIEKRLKIKQQLVLQQQDFLLNEVTQLYPVYKNTALTSY